MVVGRRRVVEVLGFRCRKERLRNSARTKEEGAVRVAVDIQYFVKEVYLVVISHGIS